VETEKGVTLTVTAPLYVVLNYYCGYTMWKNFVEQTVASDSITFAFNKPVQMVSMHLTDWSGAEANGVNYTFTSNTGVSYSSNINGSDGQVLSFPSTFLHLNWLRVTKTAGGTFQYAFDSLVVTPTTIPVTFTDGTGYTAPAASANTTNNPVGRFLLTAPYSGAVLSSVKVTFSGTATNVSNVKLWQSSDALFGSDTQIGSAQTYGSAVTFSSLASEVSTSGTYYFVTVDLGSSTGSVSTTIAATADIQFSYGSLSGTVSNAALSSGATALPVELASITAAATNASATLSWKTTTETNNYGFEVERRTVGQTSLSDWTELGFVAGNGSSNVAHSYSYTDNSVSSGTYAYRLKQIDNDGTSSYSSEAEVTITVPLVFALNQNYPNPFNPTTTISFTLAKDGYTTLKIFDVLGREITTLVNGTMKAGIVNSITFSASKLASGVYFSRLESSGSVQLKKLMVLK
jgi:hypothetical protein